MFCLHVVQSNKHSKQASHSSADVYSIYIARRWKKLLCVYQCIRMKHPASDLQERKAKLIIGSFHLQYSDPTMASCKLCRFNLITATSRMNSVSCENIVWIHNMSIQTTHHEVLHWNSWRCAHYRLTLFKHIPPKFDQTSSLSFPNTQMFGPEELATS